MRTSQDKVRGTLSNLVGLVVAALMLASAVSAAAAETFELMVHRADVPGAREIENGDYDRASRLLEARLGGKYQPHSQRAPLLINLCVVKIMSDDLEAAQRYCDEAVELGWSAGLAYNTRGVLAVAKGDYEAAARNFTAAIRRHGADALAKRNLRRAQAVLARQERQGYDGNVVARSADSD